LRKSNNDIETAAIPEIPDSQAAGGERAGEGGAGVAADFAQLA
jgi:hypothetical protein